MRSKFTTTVFDKILDRTIPSHSVYEDEHVIIARSRSMPSKISIPRPQFISLSSPKLETDSPAYHK